MDYINYVTHCEPNLLLFFWWVNLYFNPQFLLMKNGTGLQRHQFRCNTPPMCFFGVSIGKKQLKNDHSETHTFQEWWISQDYITKFQKANTPTHYLPTARRKKGLVGPRLDNMAPHGIGLLDIHLSTFTNSSTSHNEENIKRKHSTHCTHAPHLHSLMSNVCVSVCSITWPCRSKSRRYQPHSTTINQYQPIINHH